MNLKLLRILTILAPSVLIGLFEWLRHSVFEEIGAMLIGNLVVVAAVTVSLFFLTRYIFGVIEKTQRENLRRNRELAALNSVAQVVNESLNLEVILNRAIERVIQVVGADAGEVFLLDEHRNKVAQRTRVGLLGEGFEDKGEFEMDNALYSTLIDYGKTIEVPDLSLESMPNASNFAKRGFRCLVGVPVRSRRNVIGAILVYGLTPNHFSRDDTRLLSNIGLQVAIAIENARLHDQVHLLAAAEERERIAKEMHDGIAQVLSYVGTKSQAARQLISAGQTEEAQVQIQQLEHAAQDLYSDVREAILGLRNIISAESDVVNTLKEYMFYFNQMSSIKTDLDIRDNSILSLPPASQVQVIRIIQEALSNVRKHSKANHAYVLIDAHDGQVSIAIEDNGYGFDVSANSKQDGVPHFGLQTMKERADSIGGTLDIQSAIGRGTKVVLIAPITTRANT